MVMSQKEKVILAYSGGLDTSIIIPWLKENYDYEVIAMAADVGQGEELDHLNEKALNTGASKIYIEDLKEVFVTDFIYPTLKAGAVYEGKYLLGTSFARPIIAQRMVEIAKQEGATAIAHGATGKGNDQVRFELTVKALAPELKIIAPWRIWDIKSREDAIDYAQKRNIPIPVSKKDNYSMDRNLWHLSHEGSDLEDPWNEPQYDNILKLMVSPEKAPDKPTYVEITFEKGIPVSVNGQKYNPVELINILNIIGGQNGIGIVDMVENRYRFDHRLYLIY
jgi:argininosuccinate synthase